MIQKRGLYLVKNIPYHLRFFHLQSKKRSTNTRQVYIYSNIIVESDTTIKGRPDGCTRIILFSDLNEKLQEICVPRKEFFEIFTHKKGELKGREFRETRSKKILNIHKVQVLIFLQTVVR